MRRTKANSKSKGKSNEPAMEPEMTGWGVKFFGLDLNSRRCSLGWDLKPFQNHELQQIVEPLFQERKNSKWSPAKQR